MRGAGTVPVKNQGQGVTRNPGQLVKMSAVVREERVSRLAEGTTEGRLAIVEARAEVIAVGTHAAQTQGPALRF